MAKELMNEAERFLLKNWTEARLLEESMDGVRTKYKELFQKIIDAVQAAHAELDGCVIYATQFWGKGTIGLARKSWPDGDSNDPPGFWVGNIRLEVLTSDEGEQPYACTYIPDRVVRKLDLDVSDVTSQLAAAAKKLLSQEQWSKVDSSAGQLYFAAPTKTELLDLLADGDGQKFVERFESLFDVMAQFVPVLDKLLQQANK